MPETPDLFNEVAILRDEIEEQGEMISALVRASGADMRQKILDEMKSDPVLAGVLLLVDGNTSQGEMPKRLQDQNSKGVSTATVSRKLDRLSNDLHLIHFVRRTASGKVYRKSRLDQALGISRGLSKKA